MEKTTKPIAIYKWNDISSEKLTAIKAELKVNQYVRLESEYQYMIIVKLSSVEVEKYLKHKHEIMDDIICTVCGNKETYIEVTDEKVKGYDAKFEICLHCNLLRKMFYDQVFFK